MDQRQAQDSDPGARGLRQTYNDLETQRRATHAALAELDTADQTTPARPTVDDAGLLDALPHLAVNLTEAPEQLLRGLFETIRLPADDLPIITRAADWSAQANALFANRSEVPGGQGVAGSNPCQPDSLNEPADSG
jgi:hypothetical protein